VRSFPSSTGGIQLLTSSIGFQSKQLIVDAGLVLGDVDQHPKIDVTLDGADE
jgi:ribose 5-phosphate isomerase